ERTEKFAGFDLRKPEIKDLHRLRHIRAVGADHDVQRFQVAMDDALMMSGPDARADRGNKLESALGRKFAFAGEKVVERFALDVLHHQDRNVAVDDAVVRNADDVLMTDRSGRESFLPEARNKLRIVADKGRQNDLYRVQRL